MLSERTSAAFMGVENSVDGETAFQESHVVCLNKMPDSYIYINGHFIYFFLCKV
jgi:hypothetical protein